MKAFLLAAGEGTRLRPLTDTVAKCLVPICGIPLLEIWLELCQRHQIEEVLINLHWQGDAVKKFLRETRVDVKVRWVEEAQLLGSAGTIAANRSWIAREEAFWILYADVLTDANLTKMLQFHGQRQAEFTMGLVPTDEPQRCGIAVLDGDGRVRAFEEKPAHPRSNLAFSGILLAAPTLCDFIPPRVPSDLGRDVFPGLIGRMHGHLIEEFLLDVGTMQNYQLAQQLWKKRASAEPNISGRDSTEA